LNNNKTELFFFLESSYFTNLHFIEINPIISKKKKREVDNDTKFFFSFRQEITRKEKHSIESMESNNLFTTTVTMNAN
jgi:hypothetical protein